MSDETAFDISRYYSPDELATIKRELASALMRYPMDPAKAVMEVEPRVTHHSVLFRMQYDPEVNAYMSELRRSDLGVKSLLPTKEEFAATIYREGMSARTADVKLDYFKLLAQVMGFVETGKGSGNGNVAIAQQNVIVLPAKQDGKDFEGKWIEYGRQLTGTK